MTPQELRRICTAHGYAPALVATAGTRKRWQATAHDRSGKTVYLCTETHLARMTEQDIVDKLSGHRVEKPPLHMTRLPGGYVELRRGPSRKRGTVSLVLGRSELEQLQRMLTDDALSEDDQAEAQREARWTRQDQLDKLTVPELRQLATTMGLRVGAGVRKQQIIWRIVQAEGLAPD